MNDNMYITKSYMYGIRMYNLVDNKCNILFERKYDIIMNDEAIKEAKFFYEGLCENDKKDVKIKIYTKCEGLIYKDDSFMVWWDQSLDDFQHFIISSAK